MVASQYGRKQTPAIIAGRCEAFSFIFQSFFIHSVAVHSKDKPDVPGIRPVRKLTLLF